MVWFLDQEHIWPLARPVLAKPEVRLSTTVRHTVLTVAYCCAVPVAKT